MFWWSKNTAGVVVVVFTAVVMILLYKSKPFTPVLKLHVLPHVIAKVRVALELQTIHSYCYPHNARFVVVLLN